MFRRGKVRALIYFSLGFLASYSMIRMTSGSAESVLLVVSGYLVWAVPLILVTTLTLFSSILRLFDKIESAYLAAKDETPVPLDEAEVSTALEKTEELMHELVGNGFFAICVGLIHFILLGLRAVDYTTFPYPRFLREWRPDWIGSSADVGLAAWVLVLTFNQFLSIRNLISLYRFLSIDVHRREPSLPK